MSRSVATSRGCLAFSKRDSTCGENRKRIGAYFDYADDLPEISLFAGGAFPAAHRVENLVEIIGSFRRRTFVGGEAEWDRDVPPSSAIIGGTAPIGSIVVALTSPPLRGPLD